MVLAGKRHHDKNTGRHLLRKRAVALTAPVNSIVNDVSESSTFSRDHDSKLRQLSQSGEMYPEHGAALSRRKSIPKKVADDNDDDDADDSSDKKFKISKDDSDNVEDEKSSTDDDSSDDDTTSGSGDEEDDDGKDTATDSDVTDDEVAGGSKKQCRKRCKTPLTFHQCAFPRCSQKLGTIKDLCFFLCKHQKEKCERVCD